MVWMELLYKFWLDWAAEGLGRGLAIISSVCIDLWHCPLAGS